jgi:carbonic anhydrase
VEGAFADLIAGARANAPDGPVPPRGAARGLAVVTCVDSRVDPARAFGLASGDAAVLRNAGGRATEDVLRSLGVVTAVLGVTRVALVHHTDCRMAAVTDQALVDAVARATGRADIEFEPLTIADHETSLRLDVAAVRDSPLIPDATTVAGFLYDLRTGDLAPLA